jgi:hypothetical protein
VLRDALLKIRGEANVKTALCERVEDVDVKHSCLFTL